MSSVSAPSRCAAPTVSGWVEARSCGASGSDFQCRAITRAGSAELEVDDPGDFQVGQEVTVSGCRIHYYGTVYNDREPYYGRNLKPLGEEIEVRGLDQGIAWQTFLLHITDSHPTRFSWMTVAPEHQRKATTQPILKRHWAWNREQVPVTAKWVPLSDGVSIRFRKKNWLPGQCIALHARNRLLARILAIRGKTIVLDRKASAGSDRAVVRHFDQDALQRAVDRAVAAGMGLFIPPGRYRLDTGLWIRNASLRVEGVDSDHTVLDVTEAHTAAFWIAGGRNVAIRNLSMVGHTGFLEMPANVEFFTATGHPFYPMANQQMEVKGCAAANIVSTEHLLFEDVRVSRMASEAFYLHGSDRYGTPPYVQFQHDGMPELRKQYTKSCVYHRCHVSDCGFNVFNNNDYAENTEILHCHVERTANFCESPSRFTRIIGNYVKDGCATSVHLGARPKSRVGPRRLAGAHAIIADNVFEGGVFSGGIAIGKTASNVTITGNVFVGFSKENAICIWGGDRVIVSGNQIDLTCVDGNPDNQRCGVNVETSGVIVSGNHIYADGKVASKATGIGIAHHVTGLHVHDNIIENCGDGVVAGARVYVPDGRGGGAFAFLPTASTVTAVVNALTFTCSALPPMRDLTGKSNRWMLRWMSGRHKGDDASIRVLSPDGCRITTTGRHAPDAGDQFIVYPERYDWQIHNNTIRDCGRPLEVDLPGSQDGLVLRDNTVSCCPPRRRR